jgi:hypothetical protein
MDGYSAVNTDGMPLPAHSPRNIPPTYTGWHINHYATKSFREFELKIARGSGDGGAKGWEYFQYVDSNSTEICPRLEWPGYTAVISTSSSTNATQPTQSVTTIATNNSTAI